MSNNKPAVIHELNEVAARIREREETIQKKLDNFQANIVDLGLLAQEQGKDFCLVVAKLPNSVGLEEWRACHTPNVAAERVAKYRRVAEEQLDPNQSTFLWFKREPKQIGDTRMAPKPAEVLWGLIYKVKGKIKDYPVQDWSDDELQRAWTIFAPIAREHARRNLDDDTPARESSQECEK